ncbi:MAG: class I SAM-dependent methyltransferase [Bacteroidia bacterium]
METNSEEYKKHLEEKYLPGRDVYLNTFFYPKIVKQFIPGPVMDLGFGTGAFLRYLSAKGYTFSGIDSNPHLVGMNKENGLDVALDDVTKLETIDKPLTNAICDNVLEHLDMDQIDSFFNACKQKFIKNGILVVIVPDKKGYKRDPTHKTFVTKEIIQNFCKKQSISLIKDFCHPFNSRFIGRVLYLNMQVFVIKF